ncbi:MAG TPA: hypothetical protein VIF82_07910 [Burkholderiaceae bacterium]|jgi:hypothetical protein
MIDNTPPVIPKEPASWKGTILSITVHALLFGVIWVAMRHGSESQSAKSSSQSEAQSQTGTATAFNTSPAIPPQIKSAVKDVKAEASTSAVAAAPINNAESSAATIEAAVKPMPQQALLPDPEPKHISQTLPVASIEKNKSTEEKIKRHKKELAIAKLAAKQKSEALAQKMEQKKKAEEAKLLAKKRAEELAIKVAAESQKRKELEDKQAMEKLHQEEMQRIKNSLAGNG